MLLPHLTIFAVLEVLADRETHGAAQQQALLRALLEEAQASPEIRLWRQILLCAFLPMLSRIRAQTIQGEHCAEDLDSALGAAFLEVVHSYPLHRRGSIATSLRLDTRKRYFRILRMEREVRRAQRQLADFAERLVEADKPETYNFNLFDHQEQPQEPLPDANELREMRAVLDATGCVSRGDADLLMATCVERRSIREFMVRRGLATGDTKADDQTFQRLKKRRQRARERIRPALRKRVRS